MFSQLLTACSQTPLVSRPRYVRVNSLKMDTESALQELGKVQKVAKDDPAPDLFMLPSGTDLHDHPLVLSGSVVLQGKTSCMVAVALGPKPGWQILDACATPGNKTVHLAALMGGNFAVTSKLGKMISSAQRAVIAHPLRKVHKEAPSTSL